MVFDDIVLMMRVFVTTEECSDFGRIERKVDKENTGALQCKKTGRVHQHSVGVVIR